MASDRDYFHATEQQQEARRSRRDIAGDYLIGGVCLILAAVGAKVGANHVESGEMADGIGLLVLSAAGVAEGVAFAISGFRKSHRAEQIAKPQ